MLATGYFLIAREAVLLLKAQDLGGSIVFIGSKNALVASPGAAAYCTAKAAELHLARCLALECAPAGIRVNVVNPDAVLRGSRIWQGEWAEQRARQNKTDSRRGWRRCTGSGACSSAACIRRMSPRPWLSSPPSAPPSRPVTSSTSMPAMPGAFQR